MNSVDLAHGGCAQTVASFVDELGVQCHFIVDQDYYVLVKMIGKVGRPSTWYGSEALKVLKGLKPLRVVDY